MSTFSLAHTAVGATNRFQPKSMQIEDAVSNTPQAEQRTMSTGTQFLCQGPDGALSWHVFDETRSIPGVSRVVRRV